MARWNLPWWTVLTALLLPELQLPRAAAMFPRSLMFAMMMQQQPEPIYILPIYQPMANPMMGGMGGVGGGGMMPTPMPYTTTTYKSTLRKVASGIGNILSAPFRGLKWAAGKVGDGLGKMFGRDDPGSDAVANRNRDFPASLQQPSDIQDQIPEPPVQPFSRDFVKLTEPVSTGQADDELKNSVPANKGKQANLIKALVATSLRQPPLIKARASLIAKVPVLEGASIPSDTKAANKKLSRVLPGEESTTLVRTIAMTTAVTTNATPTTILPDQSFGSLQDENDVNDNTLDTITDQSDAQEILVVMKPKFEVLQQSAPLKIFRTTTGYATLRKTYRSN